jgi:hypothetical protein
MIADRERFEIVSKWRMFALPGGYSLGTFLADVVEPRQDKGRRIYPRSLGE